MHTRAAKFHQIGLDRIEARGKKFIVGVITQPPCLIWREHAIGAHNLLSFPAAHDQVIAKRVVKIFIATLGAAQEGTELLAKNLIAQALRCADFALVARHVDGELWRRCGQMNAGCSGPGDVVMRRRR